MKQITAIVKPFKLEEVREALAAPGGQFWHDIICGTRLVDTLDEPAPARR